MKRKILFIIDSLGCGGAEKSLVSLFPFLDYSNLDVFLYIVLRGGIFEQYLPQNISIITNSRPCHLAQLLSNFIFSTARRILAIIGIKRHGAELGWSCRKAFLPVIKEQFDVAVAYHQGFPTYYLAEKIIAKKKIAWINTDLEQAGYRPRFNRPFYEQMSTICTVSEALYRKLPDDGFLDEERLIIIKDILNVKMIREMADAPFKSNFFNNPIKLLTVGRLVPQKNYPLAVRTAEILQKKGLDFTWVFVGEGQEEDSIIRLIDRLGLKNRIVLAGQQDNPYPFFKYCDIYVHTSSVEGFGLTLSEAKILHKPIVTTNFPSAYDQIADGENGIIAQMTPESVADKILLLVDNPSLVARLIDATKRDENHTAETESALVNQLLTED